MAERLDPGDDYNPHDEHVVEIPARDPLLHPAPRRSFATIGVAVFLALAGLGITVGLISDQARRANNEVAQREELRVGWQMLGALAADGADHDSNNAAQSAAPPAAPPSSPPSVVVVTVPVQSPPPSENTAPQTAPSGTALSGAPAQAPNAAAQPALNGAIPVAVPVPALANGAPMPSAPTAPVGNGTVPAENGTVPASPPIQSLPISVPDLSPITFPASQLCGMTTCNTGSVCCNPSCGICTAPGATCPQQACG